MVYPAHFPVDGDATAWLGPIIGSETSDVKPSHHNLLVSSVFWRRDFAQGHTTEENEANFGVNDKLLNVWSIDYIVFCINPEPQPGTNVDIPAVFSGRTP